MTDGEAPGNFSAASWLDGVAEGRSTMSQRKLSAVESKLGGLARVAEQARARGVHLAVLTDDQGIELVVASLRPFKIIC